MKSEPGRSTVKTSPLTASFSASLDNCACAGRAGWRLLSESGGRRDRGGGARGCSLQESAPANGSLFQSTFGEPCILAWALKVELLV